MLDVGHNGAGTARARYKQSGLVYEQPGRLSLARQGRWVRIDTGAVDEDRKIVHGVLERTNNQSSIHVDHPQEVYLGIRQG